jgi:hypothetical protein
MGRLIAETRALQHEYPREQPFPTLAPLSLEDQARSGVDDNERFAQFLNRRDDPLSME